MLIAVEDSVKYLQQSKIYMCCNMWKKIWVIYILLILMCLYKAHRELHTLLFTCVCLRKRDRVLGSRYNNKDAVVQ